MTEPKYAGLVIILAGYQREISRMLDVNRGLKSRFTHFFDFPDWTPSDCAGHFTRRAAADSFVLEDGVATVLEESFTQLLKLDGFGNARDVDLVWKSALRARATRVMEIDEPDTSTQHRALERTDVDTAVRELIRVRSTSRGRAEDDLFRQSQTELPLQSREREEAHDGEVAGNEKVPGVQDAVVYSEKQHEAQAAEDVCNEKEPGVQGTDCGVVGNEKEYEAQDAEAVCNEKEPGRQAASKKEHNTEAVCREKKIGVQRAQISVVCSEKEPELPGVQSGSVCNEEETEIPQATRIDEQEDPNEAAPTRRLYDSDSRTSEEEAALTESRDATVPADVWAALNQAKAEAKQRALEQRAEKMRAEQERKQREAEVMEAYRVEQERIRRIRANKRRQTAEKRAKRLHDAMLAELVRRWESEEAVRREEARKAQAIQEKLRTLRRCPAGFTWFHTGGGWRCRGGTHFVSDDELQRSIAS